MCVRACVRAHVCIWVGQVGQVGQTANGADLRCPTYLSHLLPEYRGGTRRFDTRIALVDPDALSTLSHPPHTPA